MITSALNMEKRLPRKQIVIISPSHKVQTAVCIIYIYIYIYIYIVIDITYIKDKAFPLQVWTGPEGSRKLRLPDFKTIGT